MNTHSSGITILKALGVMLWATSSAQAVFDRALGDESSKFLLDRINLLLKRIEDRAVRAELFFAAFMQLAVFHHKADGSASSTPYSFFALT